MSAVIVLEDLTGIRRLFFSPRVNRRLTMWPHREVHRQIAYKAHADGVPARFVPPEGTSRTCPRCGWTPPASKTRRRTKYEPGFVCGGCPWRFDRLARQPH